MTQTIQTIFDVLEARVKQRDPGAVLYVIPDVLHNRIFGVVIIDSKGDEEFYIGYPSHGSWKLESTKEKR